MAAIFDIEQAILLLELEPPFDKRAVQLARRRMAKVWHPDIAPPGRQHEHQRHLQAINEAADQLEQLAETSRGGKVSANAVKVSAAAARRARAEEGRRAYEEAQRRAAEERDRAENDPFGSQAPAHSVVHRYARCLSYPEWGVGSVTGIYFSGEGDDVQQWARVKFQIGVRTIPAGSLQFVDFSRPDPAADRVQRFMTAAQHALAEGDPALAARRLDLRARRGPEKPGRAASADRRLLAVGQPAGGRAHGARLDPRRERPPGAVPLRRRASTRTCAPTTSRATRPRARPRSPRATPPPGSGSAGCGCGSATAQGAQEALETARDLMPTLEGLLDLALVHQLSGDVGAEVTACEAATLLAPESLTAWSRYAHALARTDRVSDAIAAAEHAMDLGTDPEVAALLLTLRDRQPRALPAESAA